MNVEDIYNMLYANIDRILNINYKDILSKNNNLVRYNILNRILIQIQFKNAYDVRSSDEWELEGRKIINNTLPIYLLIPNYSSEYIDKETGNTLKNNELTQDEILYALKHGVIRKRNILDNLYVKPVYDIKQTKSSNNTGYKIKKPIISSSELMRIFKDITKCDYVMSDYTYYSRTHNVMYIKKMEYSDLASILIDYIITYYIFSDNIQSIGLSDIETNILKQSLKYSLNTFFCVSDTNIININIISDKTRLLHILNIADSITYEIINKAKFNKSDTDGDAIYSITKLKKINTLINIMDANELNMKMKGN